MNSNATVVDPTAPPPPQAPRSSFSCDRHPDEQFSGFCPSCLCERLTTLDKSSPNTPSSSRRPSSASAAAAAAIKSLFSSSSSKPIANTNSLPPPVPPKPSKPTSFLSELRRTKSFSATKNEAIGQFCEPQRKSCDVRVRNSSTLCSLFALEVDNKGTAKKPSAPSSQNRPEYSQNSRNYESCVANKPVFVETENEDEFKDAENIEAPLVDDDGGGDEITPVLDSHLENLINDSKTEANNAGVIEAEVFNTNNLKLTKVHIDLDAREKKSSGGGFWAAASVFSKKWHNWRRKQKVKKQNNGENPGALPVDKPISRQYPETQSEVADYGFGRRSCDTEPGFSLDVGRISFDDPRYSFDEPRASWDGHLIGRTFPRIAPMISVIEDSPVTHVTRSDMQIPVEEPTTMPINITDENEVVPGGSAQTREYYSDSSSRRRKSLDRSSSMRNAEASVTADIDTKVWPTSADSVHRPKLLVRESLRDSILNSSRDDVSETFELRNGFKDGLKNRERKESKKSRSWSWRIWGFIYRLGNGNKFELEPRYGGINSLERSFSASWEELNRRGNGEGQEAMGGLNRKAFRSNSSVSWRNSNHFGGSFGSLRKPNLETNGSGNKWRDEFVLEKDRSARYSPNHINNGPLRFYLTPIRSGRRGIIKPTNSHSISRSVLRLTDSRSSIV
ncbi:protein OCTOPUS-like [Primulina huaijiensis]|uniref:protein OCTOPUS-like n=1 Tax=Primulina huaijiensis TaxID=1492673 RepID=UPI003CC70E19